MAELTIRPEEIRDALDRFVSSYEPETTTREEVGTVVDAGDGIAHVEGLPSVMTNELVEFEEHTGTAVLRVEGDCPDCEMSAANMMEGIAAHLRSRVPEVKDVRRIPT